MTRTRTGIVRLLPLVAAIALLACAASCDGRRGELTVVFTSDAQGRLGPAG